MVGIQMPSKVVEIATPNASSDGDPTPNSIANQCDRVHTRADDGEYNDATNNRAKLNAIADKVARPNTRADHSEYYRCADCKANATAD